MALTEAQQKAMTMLRHRGELSDGLGVRLSTVRSLRDMGLVALVEGVPKPRPSMRSDPGRTPWTAKPVTTIRGNLPDPDGCGTCGKSWREHGLEGSGGHGYHQYSAPSNAVRKERMKGRRASR